MKKARQHTIDFLFTIAVFFAFSATAVLVLLLSANIYRGIVESSDSNFETGTALSYITEKVRQGDMGGAENIRLCKFDDYDALAITQTYNDTTYITYIYEMNGELKESFVQEGVDFYAKAGTTIMQVYDFEIRQISDSLLGISCSSESGQKCSALINIHSTTK